MRNKNATSPFGHQEKAMLALEDGTIFHGFSIGSPGSSVGEVVFNTSMTGYQEILTDPSYSHQLVTLTYPHIGNTGINVADAEASKPHAAGLIIRDLPSMWSNFRAVQSLSEYLQCANIVGIANIDTRKLTRVLRTKGVQNGAIVPGEVPPERAVELARSFPGLVGMDLAKHVTTKRAYEWREGEWCFGDHDGKHGYANPGHDQHHVVAYDFGIKHNILRMLAQRGCRLTVVPAQTPAEEVLKYKPDGIFLSNGPGDPEPCGYAIEAIKTLVERGLPTFGICLGHQLLAQASGAKTLKMQFGHHGANHPVKDVDTGQVLITSQNHGFAVDADSLPSNCRVTHVSLFDGSLQGFERLDKPAFCFQGHPEASPGPQDVAYLFDRFIALMGETKNA